MTEKQWWHPKEEIEAFEQMMSERSGLRPISKRKPGGYRLPSDESGLEVVRVRRVPDNADRHDRIYNGRLIFSDLPVS